MKHSPFLIGCFGRQGSLDSLDSREVAWRVEVRTVLLAAFCRAGCGGNVPRQEERSRGRISRLRWSREGHHLSPRNQEKSASVDCGLKP